MLVAANPFREVHGGLCDVAGQVHKHDRRDDHVQGPPSRSRNDEQYALRIASQPDMVLNNVKLQGAFAYKYERLRRTGAEDGVGVAEDNEGANGEE